MRGNTNGNSVCMCASVYRHASKVYVPLCSHCEWAFPLIYIACTRTQICTQLLSCLFLQKIGAFESIHSMYCVVSIISNKCTRHICWNDPQTQWKVRRSTVFLPKKCDTSTNSLGEESPFLGVPVSRTSPAFFPGIPTSKRCIVVSTVGTRMLKNGTYQAWKSTDSWCNENCCFRKGIGSTHLWPFWEFEKLVMIQIDQLLQSDPLIPQMEIT